MALTTLFPRGGFGNFPLGTFREWFRVAVVVQPLPALFPARAIGGRCGGRWSSLSLGRRIGWFYGRGFCGWNCGKICWVSDRRSYGRCDGRRDWWRVIIIGPVQKKSIVFAMGLAAFQPCIVSGNFPFLAVFLRLAVVLYRPHTIFSPSVPLFDVTFYR